MQKVQKRVRKIVRIPSAIALIVRPCFSPFYFSLPQRMWIFSEVKRHALGIIFATQQYRNSFNINNL